MTGKVYGVFVCYYKEYIDEAIEVFVRILSNVSENYEIILVLNSDSDYENSNRLHVIRSDNRGWEFSAWDDGIKFLGKFNLDRNDTFIFANDTFARHRVFTKFNEFYFVYKIKSIHYSNRRNWAIGDVNTFGKPFKLLGEKSECWLSTYIFSMDYECLMLLGDFYTFDDSDLLNKVTLSNNSAKVEESSDYYNSKINYWLNSGAGWYNRNASLDLKKLKLKAIINEHLLHIRLINNHSKVIRLNTFLYKVINKAQRCFFSKSI